MSGGSKVSETSERGFRMFNLSPERTCILNKIAMKVAVLWETRSSLPFFTTHGPEHNQAVVSLLARMLPQMLKQELTELESFLLLAAAWLHDVGMLDLECFKERYATEDVRAKHHTRSARFVLFSAGELGLSSAESHIVANLVAMHRRGEPLTDCPETMLVRQSSVRTRLLAAILRLADGLHVDESRAPLREFALYRMTGMKPAAKFHWLKARAVQGIDFDFSRGTVTVQIDVPPRADRLEDQPDFKPLADFVRQEIEDEIASVKATLQDAGCPVLTDVMVDLLPVQGFERQGTPPAGEIEELNSLISVDVSPSARALSTVILRSVESIAGTDAASGSEKQTYETLHALREYAKDLVPKIAARACHVAAVRPFCALVFLLRGETPPDPLNTTLVELVRTFTRQQATPGSIEDLLGQVVDLTVLPKERKRAEEILQEIRKYYRRESDFTEFVKTGLSEVVGGGRPVPNETILKPEDRILVLGTSASVIELLSASCSEMPDLRVKLEVLVAECRGKSNYSPTSRIAYNDGMEYAWRVRELGIKKVAVIPDAAIAHLLLPSDYYADCSLPTDQLGDNGATEDGEKWVQEDHPISKVFIGFNGLDLARSFAIHSCGHLAVVLLAGRTAGAAGSATSSAKSYLVGTTNKCGRVDYVHHAQRLRKKWLAGDDSIWGKPPKVTDINPREDIIKLSEIDWVVSDLGVLPPGAFVLAAKKWILSWWGDTHGRRDNKSANGSRSSRSPEKPPEDGLGMSAPQSHQKALDELATPSCARPSKEVSDRRGAPRKESDD